MAAFGDAILRDMPEVHTIFIYKITDSEDGFDYARNFPLQHQWLTQWDERHPHNKLSHVHFDIARCWVKRDSDGAGGVSWEGVMNDNLGELIWDYRSRSFTRCEPPLLCG